VSKEPEVKPGSFSGLSVDAFFLLDENLNLLSINDAGQKMFGVSQAGVFGKCVLDIIPDIRNTGIYKKYRHVLKTGKSIALHLELEGRHLSIQVFKQGDALGMIAADITEHKKAEEALRAAEVKYRIVADNTYDWECWLNPEGRFVYVSPSCERITGHTAAEFEANPELLTQIAHQEDRAGLFAHLHDAVKMAGSASFSFRVIRPDGTERWIEHICQPVFDSNRKFIGRRGSNRDITDRKRMEEALQNESAMRELLLENLPCIALILRKGTREIVYSNTTARQLGALPGKTCYETCAQRGDPCPFCLAPEVWATDSPRQIEVEYRGKHYEGRWIPLSNDLYVHYIFDITERKKAEEDIRVLLREKELLLREIEHRVKNNLQVISSLLDMTMMMASNQEAAELLEDVRSKVLALGLVHSRLYGADSLDQIDMDAYILEHVSHLKRIYEMRGKSTTHGMEPSGVYLSVNQAIPCALVLNEVICNSFKHAFEGREGGTIETSIHKSADGMVTVRVKDDGIGIPEGFDIEKANTLGMELIRNLVQEQLHGKLQMRRDRGTEVVIEFKA
jgi:PAS domain S-box-containing protein